MHNSVPSCELHVKLYLGTGTGTILYECYVDVVQPHRNIEFCSSSVQAPAPRYGYDWVAGSPEERADNHCRVLVNTMRAQAGMRILSSDEIDSALFSDYLYHGNSTFTKRELLRTFVSMVFS